MAFFLLAALAASSPLSAEDLVARCDAAASHPDDPDKVMPGLEREEMSTSAAEAACRAALTAAPESARTAYHLGRAIYYQGRHQEARPYLEQAARAGYRQSVFVLGYVLSTAKGADADLCRAQELWRQGVALNHPWSGYHLVQQQLDGKFAGCPRQVSAAELRRFMKVAADRVTVTASAGRVEALAARLNAVLEKQQ